MMETTSGGAQQAQGLRIKRRKKGLVNAGEPGFGGRVLARSDCSWIARWAAGVAAGHAQRSDGGGVTFQLLTCLPLSSIAVGVPREKVFLEMKSY